MTPRVSIITPSYNQVEYLEETLTSVLNQDYPDLEYIVVDGGSDDGSVEVIQRYEDQLATWVSEPDMGQTDAINKGFAMANGDILAWLNSDDTYEPGAISEAVAFLERHREIGMVYGSVYYVNGTGKRIGRYPAKETDYSGLRRGVNTVSQQAMFFRAKLWRMAGPLDPTFYYAMDYDLWVRIAALTPIAYHDRHWANFRLHGGSKSMTSAAECWPEIMRVHFRDGGSRFSLIYLKYLIRRLVEPLMPWRMRLRLLGYGIGKRLGTLE